MLKVSPLTDEFVSVRLKNVSVWIKYKFGVCGKPVRKLTKQPEDYSGIAMALFQFFL